MNQLSERVIQTKDNHWWCVPVSVNHRGRYIDKRVRACALSYLIGIHGRYEILDDSSHHSDLRIFFAVIELWTVSIEFNNNSIQEQFNNMAGW